MDSYTTKLAVRDSLDDDDLSDVDDEVFIRDGKNGSKLVEDRGVKRPLMAPRRKICKEGIRNRHPPCRIKCVFYCYAVIALVVLLGLIGLTVLIVSIYPLPMDRIRPWFSQSVTRPLSSNLLRPCTSFRVTNMWNVTIPKRSTESSIRSVDVNEDGIGDIILGYQTESGPRPFPYLCSMFFTKQVPCQGGVMALDGNNGELLWEYWTAHPVYYIDCSADFTGDKILDCIAMGRGGFLCALDGRNGTLIWQFTNKIVKNSIIDYLVGQIIPDQDGDGVVDVIVSHTAQKGKLRNGHLVLISGKTGSEIVEIPTPSNRETYYMPQLLKRSIHNNTSTDINSTRGQMSDSVSILFGTGGQDTPGALYVIPLNGFSAGKKHLMKPTLLYQDKHKGILTPAVLVDITGDSTDDIIFSTFNGSIIAMDGVNYKQIWNYTFNNSETSAAIVPGYFNDDNVTDFMIKFNIGNGFPEYFYAQTLLLDGKTGKDLLHKWVIDSAPSDLAGLSISVQNRGLDLFLYWIGVCKGYEDSSDVFDEFNFVLGKSVWAQSRADICQMRFNSTLILKLYALNQYEEPPGILIYSTENLNDEYNKSYSTLNEAKEFLDEHPNFEFPIISNRRTNAELPIEEMYSNIENMNPGLFPNGKPNNEGPSSSFRHKTPGEGLIRDFSKNEFKNQPHGAPQHIHIDGDETAPDEWMQPEHPSPLDWQNEQYPQKGALPLDPNLSLPEEDIYDDEIDPRNSDRSYLTQQNRDPRSKDQYEDNQNGTTISQNKSEDQTNRDQEMPIVEPDSGIQKRIMKDLTNYDEYSNIQNARNRLLHDLSNVPRDILRQSYLEKAEKELDMISNELENKYRNRNNNKFQQRDLRYRQKNYQVSSVKKELENMYDERRRESLWDLESEKEQNDKEHGYWRGKREMINNNRYIPKIDSTGILLEPLKKLDNSIDYVFAKFWIPIQNKAQILLPIDKECISKKMDAAKWPSDKYYNLEKSTKQDLFIKMCLQKRGIDLLTDTIKEISGNSKLDETHYLNDIIELSLGQLTVQRINIQCDCGPLLDYETCGQILNVHDQRWTEFMGENGEGYFKVLWREGTNGKQYDRNIMTWANLYSRKNVVFETMHQIHSTIL